MAELKSWTFNISLSLIRTKDLICSSHFGVWILPHDFLPSLQFPHSTITNTQSRAISELPVKARMGILRKPVTHSLTHCSENASLSILCIGRKNIHSLSLWLYTIFIYSKVNEFHAREFSFFLAQFPELLFHTGTSWVTQGLCSPLSWAFIAKILSSVSPSWGKSFYRYD